MKAGDDLWHQVFERDRGICQYCQMDLLQDFQHYQLSSVDHVLSQSIGGEDCLNNLALCCNGCNTRLSRAHHLTTVEARREYLNSPESSKGARAMYAKYLDKKLKNAWR
jgi:5-methylcytosine-specific restriction endonuclease McrA